MPPGPTAAADAGFLHGGGEMGERIRQLDWAATPLGPAARWPLPLKTTVRTMLAARQPMFIWWGENLLTLYNDAYRALAGDKHPGALGQPASRAWHEVWNELGPRAARAMLDDAGTFDESLLLIAERRGFPEETYCTLSLSPLADDGDGVGGILGISTDDTPRVIRERQLAVLQDLAGRSATAHTVEEACAIAAECLHGDAHDFPFAAVYLVDADSARLAATCRIAPDHAATPPAMSLADSPWPLAEAMAARAPRIVGDLHRRFGAVPSGDWLQPPHEAVVVPLAAAPHDAPSAALVAALNPFRRFDDGYRGFVELVAARIGASIARAQRGGTPGHRNGHATEPAVPSYDQVVEALPVAVYACDAQGRVTMFNEAAAALLGRTPAPDEEMWSSPYRFYRPDGSYVPFDRSPMAVALREGRAIRGAEVVVERPDGTRRAALAHPQPIRDPSGEVVGAIDVMVDITERRTAESELRDADRRRDEFLATLAHELRNPLAPISYGLHVMGLASTGPEAVTRVREMMERQVQHMVRLIDGLIDGSRISRGTIELRRERVDLGSVALDALEASRPLIQACAHEVRVEVPREPLFVEGDAIRLTQAVSNLLNNAAKYTPRGGHIRLAVDATAGAAVVSVADDGIGIPSAMLSRVFDLFVQVDPSLERVQGGLGIGLTIVRRLVELHGGTVEARSAGPGAGSQFVVRLAAVAGPPPAPDDPGEGRERALARCRRILVVDDNRDSALALAMMLRMMGHEAHTAHDGREALEMAAATRPHVILLDLGMPGLSGHETCRRLRDQPWAKGVTIVALTGWGQEDDRRRSREAGFDGHLVKPVDLGQLARVLGSPG